MKKLQCSLMSVRRISRLCRKFLRDSEREGGATIARTEDRHMSGVVPVVGRDEGVVQVLAVVVEGRVSGAMVVVKAAEAGREVRATSADFNKDYLSCRFIRGATPPADYCEGVDCVSSEILSNKPRYRKKKEQFCAVT
jgi:hypothetical protein